MNRELDIEAIEKRCEHWTTPSDLKGHIRHLIIELRRLRKLAGPSPKLRRMARDLLSAPVGERQIWGRKYSDGQWSEAQSPGDNRADMLARAILAERGKITP